MRFLPIAIDSTIRIVAKKKGLWVTPNADDGHAVIQAENADVFVKANPDDVTTTTKWPDGSASAGFMDAVDEYAYHTACAAYAEVVGTKRDAKSFKDRATVARERVVMMIGADPNRPPKDFRDA